MEGFGVLMVSLRLAATYRLNGWRSNSWMMHASSLCLLIVILSRFR